MTNDNILKIGWLGQFPENIFQDHWENVKSLKISNLSNSYKDLHGIILRTETTVRAEFLNLFPNLRFIITATSGFNHIDFNLAQEKDILLGYTPESNVVSVAEHTWTLVLNCIKRINERNIEDWRTSRYLLGEVLSEKTLGLIGFGRIGKRVSAIAQSFGMKVIAYDPYLEDNDFLTFNVERVGLEEACRQSDILSLHSPLTKKTRYIINKKTLNWIPDTTYLINTSRGQLLNEEHVLMALKMGQLKGLGLDVFENEPLNSNSEFLRLKNVIITPHCAAKTISAFQQSTSHAIESVNHYIKYKQLKWPLPLTEKWYKEDKL